MPQPVPIVTWSEVKAALDKGSMAYFVDCGDFWDIVTRDPLLTCEIMKVGAFGSYDAEVTRYFDPEASAAFETLYKSNLPEMRF